MRAWILSASLAVSWSQRWRPGRISPILVDLHLNASQIEDILAQFQAPCGVLLGVWNRAGG